MFKKAQKLLFAVAMIVFFGIAFVSRAYALESTGNSTLDSFINDSRWTNGISWNGTQQPKPAPNARWWACAAYCYDYVKYCYGISNPRGGSAFYNTSEISAGDVLTVGNQSDGSQVGWWKQ